MFPTLRNHYAASRPPTRGCNLNTALQPTTIFPPVSLTTSLRVYSNVFMITSSLPPRARGVSHVYKCLRRAPCMWPDSLPLFRGPLALESQGLCNWRGRKVAQTWATSSMTWPPPDTTAGDRPRHPPDRRPKERHRLARLPAARGSQRPAATGAGNLPRPPVWTPHK